MNGLPAQLQNKYVIIIGVVVILLFLGLIILLTSSSNSSSGNRNGNPPSSGSGSSGSSQGSLGQQNPKSGGSSTITPVPTYAVDRGNLYPLPAYQNNDVINYKSSAYAKYGYQIFPGPISDSARQALGSFTVSTLKYPDQSTVVTLHYNQPGYSDIQVTAKPGYSVYFEKLPQYEDPGDTGLIVVDGNGEIVPQ